MTNQINQHKGNANKLIPWAKPKIFGNEEANVREALTSTWISGGPFVDRFERQVGQLTGARHACATSNGTTALHLACLAVGLQPGEEILLPGFAYMGAANIALLCGLKPVFAEVDSRTWCVTAETLSPCITARTKAIVVVHTYGNLCPMEEILPLAKTRGIPVIEDAAEAFASHRNGRHAGTFSTIGTFSFHATKTITTGEGGMAITADDDLYHRMCLYRSHGMARHKRYYWHEVAGHNFRLTNFQAAMGCAQLEHLTEIMSRRQQLHSAYKSLLEAQPGWSLQHFEPSVHPVLWALALKLDPKAFPQGRDTVISQMAAVGIECRPGFYAASQQPLYSCPPLPVCEQLATRILSLPTFVDLTEEEISRICQTLTDLRR